MAQIHPPIETFANIKVVGVGGSGGSAVNRMIVSKIRGVDFIVMNTDVQALHHSQARTKIHLGKEVTKGLGAGMDPDVGASAADESEEEIRAALKGADMVFVTCGLGGGTGSGAGPRIAEIAHEMGALTVAVVTRPFAFEGAKRKTVAEEAYERMADAVDTMITIPNDRILQIIDRKTTLIDAFEIADDVLRQGVQGISELITVPGLINVDFADVRAIMSDRGSALMGIGRGQGDNRASDAAKAAIASPLLEVSIDGAKGILFTITGGSNLGMYEVSEAAKVITQSADPDAKVIFGAIIDESLKDEVKLTVIATGFDVRPDRKQKMGSVSGSQVHIPDTLERMNFGASQSAVRQVKRAEPVEYEEAPLRREPQPSAVQPHVQAPAYTPVQERRPDPPPAPQRVVSSTAESKEDDELEIPAFIRKKMM
ncbi:MAG: cell division protein FtsZ [bacterium]|nr:cell division protein FtsZ [bacterium]